MREGQLENALRDEVKAVGGLCIKLPAWVYRGIPDRMVLLPMGRIFFIELKADRGRPSKAQLAFRTFLRSMGFYSELIRGKDELERFLNEHVRTVL